METPTWIGANRTNVALRTGKSHAQTSKTDRKTGTFPFTHRPFRRVANGLNTWVSRSALGIAFLSSRNVRVLRVW
jgi:hypothetical protein